MGAVYNQLKEDYEISGNMPFVCIVKWTPEGRSAAISRFSTKMFEDKTPEEEEKAGVKGLHGWKLMGRDTMIVIGWYNDVEELQKFCTSITFGTDICLDVCPAIDHKRLLKAYRELASSLAKFPPIPKKGAGQRKTPKAGG